MKWLALAMVVGSLVVGGALVAVSRSSPPDRPDLAIFFELTATSDQIEAVRRSLRSMKDDVRTVRFVDKAEAYEEMVELFKTQPEVVEAVSPNEAPASLRVTLRGNVDRDLIKARIEGHDGVSNIMTPGPP